MYNRILRKNQKGVRRENYDKVLFYLVLTLALFGLLMVFESSSSYAQNVFGNKYKFLFQQFVWVLIGFFGMWYVYKVKLRVLKSWAKPLMLISLGFLAVLALQSTLSKIFGTSVQTPFTKITYGAFRWVVLNPPPFPAVPLLGRISFQPTDIAKLAFILYISLFLEKISPKDKRKQLGFLVLVLTTVGLVFLEPDFGTAAIFISIAVALYFVSNLPLIYLFLGLPLMAVLGGILSFSSAYRRQRLMTFFNRRETDILKEGYHILQILIAIGSGGVFGLGFGESRQKYAYIPEVVSDSIFAVIAEEFGFVGSVVLALVFLALIWRGITIAKNQRDVFGRSLAVGISCWLGVQTFINLFAMVHLIPLTGVTLPFISYGGSSMVVSLMGVGILLKLSKH
ncbi:hypothetical protein COT69_01565 [candidate division WWE3 bacterium CG09_land_8_20_14_0_10_39_24]|uniref:Probable peptidoglycan glycosyltransferase FtsW n=2 Tax=Katanobacteria TaxID=422282 RepID=A0A2G9XCW6_UNCKA|nr:MAG: hypothetical protein COX53_00405 [candidate division WWE3 bacterium CG23_combo_of_CG06-09_8_20_14_all_40_14]PIS12903.1 MAG: hypothetical protein COT69_01565 [candidate division WWE3 bacterium CG09_land_8_20_14_0_10_39_24]PJE51731.1 MAG: hypothetical protein COV27_01550 [candidate division WWE3 bacterium CG10_big_fil_rev_8_21_14_0_10_39_14]